MYYWTPGSLSQQLGIMRNALKENTPASLEFNYLLNFNWCGFTAFQSKVPGKLREVWSWLGTPGQTQPKVVFLDTIFLLPIPLYKKSLRHCFPPELLMIKESCNLIGREYLLVINLLVYVMHNKIIFFLRDHLIFHAELFLLWHTTLRPKKPPLVTLGLSAHDWTRMTRFDRLPPEILMIKKSCDLIGRDHFGPFLVNQHFPRYEVCRGKQVIVISFILGYFQRKVMTKFYEK